MNQKSLVVTFIIFFSLYLQAQNKRALVIGLGEYEDTSWSAVHVTDLLKINNFRRGYFKKKKI